MNNKNRFNKELIFRTSASCILFVLLTLGLYALITNKSKNNLEPQQEIPKIKENYTYTTLNKYIEYNNDIKYINNKFIMSNNNNEYIITYNNSKLEYEKIDKHNIKKDYNIKTNENNNKQYILNTNNNTISDEYDNIQEITLDNISYSYLLVSNDNSYSIINLSTQEIVPLNSEITYIEEPYKLNEENNTYEIISQKYLKVSNKDNKYGIIDYNGNIIIGMLYDNIEISNDLFIVKTNNKYNIINNESNQILKTYDEIKIYNDYFIIKENNKYKMIDTNGNKINNYEFDYTKPFNEYLIVINNNKLGIIKNTQLILDYQIETKNNKIDAYVYNNNLHINTYTNDIKTYIIENNKIKKVINNMLNTIKITDYEVNNNNEISNIYTYTTNIKNNKLNFTIYNNAFDKHYEQNIELDIDTTKYNIFPTLTKNYSNDYYKLSIISSKIDNNNETILKEYYYDIDNQKVINEKKALSKYLDNGYKITLNQNNELKVYKKEEIISTHNNIKYHIGGYYFSDINGIIYKLEFKNESNK